MPSWGSSRRASRAAFATRSSGSPHDRIALPTSAAKSEWAEEQGLRRPSYEQVRLIVVEQRRRPCRISTGEVLLDVALRVRHPDAFIGHVSGVHTLQRSK